jgi:hypothetical protein
MTKWEYKSLLVQITNTGPNIDLPKFGADGWELVSVAPKIVALNLPELKIKPGMGSQTVTAQQNAWQQTTELIYIFKRPSI